MPSTLTVPCRNTSATAGGRAGPAARAGLCHHSNQRRIPVDRHRSRPCPIRRITFRLVQDSPGHPANVLGLTPDSDGSLWVRMIGPTSCAFTMAFSNRPSRNRDGRTVMCRRHGPHQSGRSSRFHHGAWRRYVSRRQVRSAGCGYGSASLACDRYHANARRRHLGRNPRRRSLPVRQGQSTSVTKGLPDSKSTASFPTAITDCGSAPIVVSPVGTEPAHYRRNSASLNGLQALAIAKTVTATSGSGPIRRALRLNSRRRALDPDGKGSGEAVTAVLRRSRGQSLDRQRERHRAPP